MSVMIPARLVVGQRRLRLFHFRRALRFIVERGQCRYLNRRARMRAYEHDATDEMKDHECDRGRDGKRADAIRFGANHVLGSRRFYLDWHLHSLSYWRPVGRCFWWP